MAFCCNLLCIIDTQSLDTIIQKNFTPHLKIPVAQHEDIIRDFKNLYRIKGKEHLVNNVGPVIQSTVYEFVNYVYIVRSQVLYLCVVIPFLEKYNNLQPNEISYSAKNVNIMSCLSYLTQLHELMTKYFKDQSSGSTNELARQQLSETDSTSELLTPLLLRDNHNIIVEIFDESIDFGIPQLTDCNMIQEYINLKPVLEHVSDDDDGDDDDGGGDDDKYTNFEDGKNGESSRKHHKGWMSKFKSTKRHVPKHKKPDKQDQSKKPSEVKSAQDESYMNSFLVRTTTDSINWRPKGIYYVKNEFFLDVIEKLEYFQDLETGDVKENYLSGIIYCKSYLSGMPFLKIGISDDKLKLNNETILEKNFRFHHCVKLDNLNTDSEIQFVPPDGEFELASYEFKRRRQANADPPSIKIVEYDIKENTIKKTLRINTKFTTFFKKGSSTSFLKISLPMKDILQKYQVDLTKPLKFKTDWGKIYFNISDDFILWDVGNIKGGYGDKMYESAIQFSLVNEEQALKDLELLKNSMDPPPLRKGPKLDEIYKQLHAVEKNETKEVRAKEEEEAEEEKEDEEEEEVVALKNKPAQTTSNSKNKLIKIEFEIPYYTCSGLKIDFLKINENDLQNYQSFPWIRYKTVNNDEYYFQTP